MPEGHDTIIEVSNIMSFVLYTQILKQSVLKAASPGITLNANNYIDICSIPSKFHMYMYERMKNIYTQNQSSIHWPCVWKVVHNRTF